MTAFLTKHEFWAAYENVQALLDSKNFLDANVMMNDILSRLSSKVDCMRDDLPYSAAGDALDTQLDLLSREIRIRQQYLDETVAAAAEYAHLTEALDKRSRTAFCARTITCPVISKPRSRASSSATITAVTMKAYRT
jgi:hypothetical protein